MMKPGDEYVVTRGVLSGVRVRLHRTDGDGTWIADSPIGWVRVRETHLAAA